MCKHIPLYFCWTFREIKSEKIPVQQLQENTFLITHGAIVGRIGHAHLYAVVSQSNESILRSCVQQDRQFGIVGIICNIITLDACDFIIVQHDAFTVVRTRDDRH